MKRATTQPLDALVLNALDNVATALRALRRGEVAVVGTPDGPLEVGIGDAIARCHKFAVRPLTVGESVKKYGEVIGVVTRDTPAGAHVHTHNIRSLRASRLQ